MERLRSKPLPEKLRLEWERASGVDLGDVVVHDESGLPELLGAVGLAWGRHIFLAPGAEEYLRHELVHVIQQRQGRVPGGGLVEDPALEAEAQVGRPPVSQAGGAEPTPALQCCKWCGDSTCKLSAPACVLGRITKMKNVDDAVKRVHALDSEFLPSGYGEMTWNPGLGVRPGPLKKVWDSVKENQVNRIIRGWGGWRCPYCRKVYVTSLDIDVDHNVPWALYMKKILGLNKVAMLPVLPAYVAVALANDPNNLLAVCKHCNRSKGDKDPDSEDFLEWWFSRLS